MYLKMKAVAGTNHSGAVETRDHSKNGASPKSQMSRIIILILMLSSLFGAATAQEHVSNIRIQQSDGMLYVTYDLAVNADIEVFASFDGGATYRGPLQRVSGAVGKGILAGKDKVLIWSITREIGYVNNSSIVIRISANAITSSENSVVVSIEKPEHSKYYLGFSGGLNVFIYEGENIGLFLGLNGAYFFNHQMGVGFAVHHSQNKFLDWDNDLLLYRETLRKNYFLGPAFYGHWGRLNGKVFFPTSVGIGWSWNKDYYYDDEYSKKWNVLGYFVSGGVAYRPIERISIGLNCNFYVRSTGKELIDLFDNNDIYWAFTLGINFHF